MAGYQIEWISWQLLVHSARTAVAAVASLLTARLFQLPEAYWASITTLVIAQSSLGAAFSVFWQRFFGTALGAVLGALAASYFGPHVLVFGSSVFVLGLLRALARLDLPAYRFGSVTLAIVLLVPGTGHPWEVAFHRFAEVSIGIGVALILAWLWPERETELSGKHYLYSLGKSAPMAKKNIARSALLAGVREKSMKCFFDASSRFADPAEIRKVCALVEPSDSAGFMPITLDFYPVGRHETLHEANRREVFRNLLVSISSILKRRS